MKTYMKTQMKLLMKNIMRKASISLSVLIAFLMTGCTNIPEKLQLNDNSPNVVFAAVRAQPNANTGLNARWGGIIAKVENQKNRTMIEVVNFKLSSRAKPIQANETQGRFRFYYKGLLDPVIFKEGKSITVVGTIANSEQGKIGEQKYLYPVLNAQNYYLWKDLKRTDIRITQQPFWYTPSYWYYPSYPYSGVSIHRHSSNASTKPASSIPKSNKH